MTDIVSSVTGAASSITSAATTPINIAGSAAGKVASMPSELAGEAKKAITENPVAQELGQVVKNTAGPFGSMLKDTLLTKVIENTLAPVTIGGDLASKAASMPQEMAGKAKDMFTDNPVTQTAGGMVKELAAPLAGPAGMFKDTLGMNIASDLMKGPSEALKMGNHAGDQVRNMASQATDIFKKPPMPAMPEGMNISQFHAMLGKAVSSVQEALNSAAVSATSMMNTMQQASLTINPDGAAHLRAPIKGVQQAQGRGA